MDDIKKPVIAVWFSCGAASAVAAKMTIEQYGETHEIRVLNNPVLEEDEDNLRFKSDVEKWLGVKIETVFNKNFPDCSAVSVWGKRRYMSGTNGAPCTQQLKKVARQQWEKENHVDWHVFGFTFDEKARHDNFILSERSNVIPVLINLELTKDDCFKILNEWSIKLPRIYSMGYPNANCIGCVKATSATYWSLVREKHPDIYRQRAEQSRDIGCRLVRYKNKRLFLDELPVGAKGRSLKKMNIECGLFCEEKFN